MQPIPRSHSFRHPALVALALALAFVGDPRPSPAASTGTTGLLTPQGSGSSTPNGDFISTTGGGLNTSYRYFIEVPPGVSRLVVEIFDADVGLGGGGEDDAGRDRQRGSGWNTSASYSLRDPSGTVQTTRFTTGNNTGPTGSDNAWLTLYNATGNSVADNFGTAAYSNNDGNNNWAGNWIESDNGGGGATGGAIQIVTGELRLEDDVTGTPSIQREVDLLGSPGLNLASAYLSFDFSTSNNLEDSDDISVQVSGNGGGSWTTLEQFSNDGSGSRSYDITGFIANNTRIRFIFVSGYDAGTEFFFVDDLQITDGVKTAGHWELRVDQSSAVTTGDDINALGIQAHDGNAGSGGTELNLYYDSHSQFGVNPDPDANTRSYALYPYLTSGCSASKNDFDYDSDSGNTGSLSFTSRTGTFTQNYASGLLSEDDEWDRRTFSGWTSDTLSSGYGIWTAGLTINTYGSTSGNYTHLWLGNFQAAANPPGANPTTNAFRVYFASDAVAAPLKPFLQQTATFSGCGLSGPNPPTQGQTSCFTVTVRVENPTAQAITFSTPSNIVTANVPGGGAVYAGGAQATPGTTIVSEPLVGGTGNITWNPGTVAAGAAKSLSYRVNVTPVSNGQRIPITATPGSGNGTRAQYLDETGNASQARATYLFGPLCELAVTEDLLTHAVVSSFRASRADGGGVLLEWETASEAGTAGFYLKRWDEGARRWAPVNRELLAGLLHAPQGGAYRFVDDGASPSELLIYRLEEVEAGGQRRTFGPFRAEVDQDRTDPRGSDVVYERAAHAAKRRAERPEKPSGLQTQSAAVLAIADGAHLSVRETGLYYLSTADVAAWLGLSEVNAAAMITKGSLALTRAGQPVAWYPDRNQAKPALGKASAPGARGLFFYGEAPDSLYTGVTVYRLQAGQSGVIMSAQPAETAPAAEGGTFLETLHTERDAFPAPVISPDPESDYWFWEFLQGDDPTFGHRTFLLDAPGVSSADGGMLAVTLHGATASGATNEHQATVSLNGTALGGTQWTGIASHTAELPVPAGLLLETGNQLEVTAQTGGGAPFSIYYADGFDLTYQRKFLATGNALAFTAGGSPEVSVSGFSSPAVRLIDVTDPLQPLWISGAAVEADKASGFRLSFTPPAEGRYLATAALKSPVAVRPWSAPSLRRVLNQAEYLVVAPAGLRGAAENLASLRRAQGLASLVVDLDQISDEFGGGVLTPHAIRAFLGYAWASWRLAPRYVALAGEGTLDYRNLLGFGDNLVPPLMVQAAGGLFPSDNLLGDLDADGLPEMAVGRIPVLSAQELDAYTKKISAYEAAPAAGWTGSALLLADAADGGADFAADGDRIAAQIPAGYSVERIDLSAVPLSTARSQLLSALDEGVALINYLGHGALDRLASDGLLTNADVPGLANGLRLPVLTAMTCAVNRFAVPGFPALGELLVKSPAGGAAGVWGPTGLSVHGEALLLATHFYHATDERLGDRILSAIARFKELGGDPALPRIYDLLGDPALGLKAPALPAPTPSGSGE